MSPIALIAGLLAALGAGGAVVLGLRPRRKREDLDPAHASAPLRQEIKAEAVSQPAAAFAPELPLPAYAAAWDMAPEPVARATGSRDSSAVVAAGPAPRTRAERDALLEQMVAAPPDAENPFTSRKGRMRRAKLILQAREFEQGKAETQTFDWRTYRTATSNPATATPPRVTA